jgi:hypothetical protein
MLFAARLEFFNRGNLLAFAEGHGVYEADLRRTLVEWRYANGIDEKDRHAESHDNRLVLRRLILDAVARSLAGRKKSRQLRSKAN